MRKPEEYIGRLVCYSEVRFEQRGGRNLSKIIGVIIKVEKELGHNLRREKLKDQYQKDFASKGIIHGGSNVFVVENEGDPELWAWTRPCIFKIIIAPLKEVEFLASNGRPRMTVRAARNMNDQVTSYLGAVQFARPGETCGDFAARMMKKCF